MRFFEQTRRALAAAAIITLCASGPAFALNFIRDAEVERTLAMLLAPILDAAKLPRNSVHIHIINNPDINAFVARGRNIFVNTGTLMQLETPDELVSVLAHEVGHITGGHLPRRSGQYQGPAAIIGLFLGITQRAALANSRADEASADQAAMGFMESAGIDPTGFVKVMKRLEKEQQYSSSRADPYLLSHPLSSARIAFVKRRVRESHYIGAPFSKEVIYWHRRMRTKLDAFLNEPREVLARAHGQGEMALLARAIALHRSPAPDKAIKTVSKLIEMRPKDPFYWELKGQILSESGRGPKAVAPYRRAVKLAPDQPLILAALGKALLDSGSTKNNAEALSLLEHAAIADSTDINTRRWLAIAYANDGQEGMAAVVTAERLALSGALGEATVQAKHAEELLPTGSPGWLRAQDILTLRPPG